MIAAVNGCDMESFLYALKTLTVSLEIPETKQKEKTRDLRRHSYRLNVTRASAQIEHLEAVYL